jgi:hypothetical protein
MNRHFGELDGYLIAVRSTSWESNNCLDHNEFTISIISNACHGSLRLKSLRIGVFHLYYTSKRYTTLHHDCISVMNRHFAEPQTKNCFVY